MKNETDEKKARQKKERKAANSNESKESTKRNGWKIAFLLLIGIIVGSLIFVVVRVTQVREPNYATTELVERDGSAVLTVQSTKKQVNQLIDFFLDDFQAGSDVKYEFYLENEAMLKGTFNILGNPIHFYLYFEPYVMDNGNVQLKAKSLSIGTLGLPIKEILKFIQRDYKLPSWVEVNPDERTVILRLDQFQMQNGLYLKAEKINLVDDDIRMNLYLPTTGDSSSTDN